MAESKDLLQILWSGADILRGKMDANEYKTVGRRIESGGSGELFPA